MNTDTHLIRHFGPSKDKFSRGVSALQLLPSGNLLVGTGDGVLAVLQGAPGFKKVRSSGQVAGAITSVALQGSGEKVGSSDSQSAGLMTCFLLQFFVGTCRAQMYQCDLRTLEPKLVSSCHYSAVTDIVFPRYVTIR